jgi:TonB family protein
MRLLISLILLLQAGTGEVSDGALKQALNTKYEKKLVTVRGFPTGTRVRFDTEGKLVDGMAGVFTLDGSLHVDSIKVGADRVELQGKQAYLAFNAKTKKLEESFSGDKMVVEFARKPGMGVEKVIDDALMTLEELPSIVPTYWAKFLTGKGELEAVVDPKTGVAIPRASEAQGLVPKGRKTPAPVLSKSMLSRGVVGKVTLRVVVDENGKSFVADLVEPVGYGLDQAAIDAVNTWEYEPARKDGKGVKVYFRVSVNFNTTR